MEALIEHVATAEALDRDRLVLDNLRLAYRIAATFYGYPVDREDLHQQALLGLVLAAQRFNPARGLQFSTFAWPTIRGTLLRYTGFDRRRSVEATPTGHVRTDDGTAFLDSIPAPEPDADGDEAEAREQLALVIGRVPVAYRRVLELRYGLDPRCQGRALTLREVGEVLGVTKERVRQLVNLGVAKLREVVRDQEERKALARVGRRVMAKVTKQKIGGCTVHP